MAITQITLTQSYPSPAPGAPSVRGQVIIELREAMTDTSTGVTVPARVVMAEVVDGVMTPQVVDANDDPTTTPIGTTYHFAERLVGAPTRDWDAVVLHAAAGATMTVAATYASP